MTVITCSSKLEQSVDQRFQEVDHDIPQYQSVNQSLQNRIIELETVCAEYQKEALIKESYSKRLNLLIHGVQENNDSLWETRDNTIDIFNHFLLEALKLDPTLISVIDIHRLPQQPIFRNGAKVTRPIIVKFQNVMDKAKVTKSLKNLKIYNQQLKSSLSNISYVYVSDHLPKPFEAQRKKLMPQFTMARKQNKKAYWRIEEGQHCFFVDDKKVDLPIESAVN